MYCFIVSLLTISHPMFQQPVMPDIKQQERLSTSSYTCYNLHKTVSTSCNKFIQVFLTFKYHIRGLFLILVSYFNSSLKFEIMAKQLYVASQRVL